MGKSQASLEKKMIKLTTFLVLLLALNYFTCNGARIRRENGWNYRQGSGTSGFNKENGRQNGWNSRHGPGASGFNPGSSNTNNGQQGYNDGSSAGSGFNSG